MTGCPPGQLAEFSEWFGEYLAEVWDEQIERDTKAGKLDVLIEEVEEDDEAGRTKPL